MSAQCPDWLLNPTLGWHLDFGGLLCHSQYLPKRVGPLIILFLSLIGVLQIIDTRCFYPPLEASHFICAVSTIWDGAHPTMFRLFLSSFLPSPWRLSSLLHSDLWTFTILIVHSTHNSGRKMTKLIQVSTLMSAFIINFIIVFYILFQNDPSSAFAW